MGRAHLPSTGCVGRTTPRTAPAGAGSSTPHRATVLEWKLESCKWCGEELDFEASFKVEPEGWYCHNTDWVFFGGTCWEQKVCEDSEEMLEWLEYGFECSGCIVTEEGECTCTA